MSRILLFTARILSDQQRKLVKCAELTFDKRQLIGEESITSFLCRHAGLHKHWAFVVKGDGSANIPILTAEALIDAFRMIAPTTGGRLYLYMAPIPTDSQLMASLAAAATKSAQVWHNQRRRAADAAAAAAASASAEAAASASAQQPPPVEQQSLQQQRQPSVRPPPRSAAGSPQSSASNGSGSGESDSSSSSNSAAGGSGGGDNLSISSAEADSTAKTVRAMMIKVLLDAHKRGINGLGVKELQELVIKHPDAQEKQQKDGQPIPYQSIGRILSTSCKNCRDFERVPNTKKYRLIGAHALQNNATGGGGGGFLSNPNPNPNPSRSSMDPVEEAEEAEEAEWEQAEVEAINSTPTEIFEEIPEGGGGDNGDDDDDFVTIRDDTPPPLSSRIPAPPLPSNSHNAFDDEDSDKEFEVAPLPD